MKDLGYYNGKYDLIENMYVPMNDRACFFGDGIYEATCVANRVPFALDDHLDRMYNSLRLLEIPFKMTRDEIKSELAAKGDGFVKAMWCGDEACEDKVKEVASATARVMCDDEGVPETCAICGKKATHKVIFARAY